MSTLNADGSRRWLRPRVSKGRFLTARRVAAYILIAIFTLIPHLKMGGKPLILLNIPARQFTLFGYTFLPTDTVLLAILLVGIVVSIFLVTALFGRVWCGWACPQTVYLEFLYRPLERLFDGPPGRGGSRGRKSTGLRTVLKYVTFLAASMFLAHTFLAYFVGVDTLEQWVRQSPLHHPVPFFVMLITTALMMFDFCFFREQTCIIACPYGRFQSVMLDRDSLIVTYDEKRGEPRKHGRRRPEDAPPAGDCVDCGLCVETCPTGIDIRKGLQLECVGCAQCIDACDHVMDKVGSPRGLIRYSSESSVAGEKKSRFRPRLVVYPAILAVLGTLFAFLVATKGTADVTVLRGLGMPFARLESGEIANPLRVKIVNRSDRDATYTIELEGISGARLVMDVESIQIKSGESYTEGVVVAVPPETFAKSPVNITLRVKDDADFETQLTYRLLGPAHRSDDEHHNDDDDHHAEPSDD